jgi:hypothetical protein
MEKFPSIPSKDILIATCDMEKSLEATINAQVEKLIKRIIREKRICLSRIKEE